MMNVMYGSGSSMFFFLWALHAAGALAFGFGVLLLLFWAFKHLNANDMWKWGWILVIAGIVACLLSFAFLPYGGKVKFTRSGSMMRGIPSEQFDTFVPTNGNIAQ